MHDNEYGKSRSYFQEASAIYSNLDGNNLDFSNLDYRKHDIRRGKADCIKSLGDIAIDQKQLNTAREHYLAARQLYIEIGDNLGLANCALGCGEVHRFRGCADEQFRYAALWYNTAMETYQDIGDIRGEANCLECLGHLQKDSGREDGAIDYYKKALILFERVGDPDLLGGCYVCLAEATKASVQRHKYAETAITVWKGIGNVKLAKEIGAKFGIDC